MLLQEYFFQWYHYQPFLFQIHTALQEKFRSVQFSSVTQSCPTHCDPMNRSTPGLPAITNSQSLLKLMSIESVMPSSHLILCHPLLLLPPIPPSIRVFSMSLLFAWGSQSIGVSASASVLAMNTQDWYFLGWTGWIFIQSKGLSRVVSNTTVQLAVLNPWTTSGQKSQNLKLYS